CSSDEPELWMYELVTPRPKPSTMPRQPSVGTDGGQTLCLRNRSRYQSSASAASGLLIATLPSFPTPSPPFPPINPLPDRPAPAPSRRMPKPYWFLSGFVIDFAHARKSSKFQSSFGGLVPYSFARSVRQYTPSLVTTHGKDSTRFLTVTVSQASGSTSL